VESCSSQFSAVIFYFYKLKSNCLYIDIFCLCGWYERSPGSLFSSCNNKIIIPRCVSWKPTFTSTICTETSRFWGIIIVFIVLTGSDPSARISCVSYTPAPVGNARKLSRSAVQSVNDCYKPSKTHVIHLVVWCCDHLFCVTVCSGKWVPACWKDVLPPPLELISVCSSATFVSFYQSVRYQKHRDDSMNEHCPEHLNTEFFVTSVCHAKFCIFISMLIKIKFDY